jgi:hypothetical protein
MRFLPKLFPFDSEELPPSQQAKRALNQAKIPKIAESFVKNSGNYTCGAIAASIDADITFEAVGNEAEKRKICRLRVGNAVSNFIQDWQLVLHKQVAAGEIRRDSVHCHSVVLESLREVGASLLSAFPESWEGGILLKGRISKSRASVSWMTDYLKKRLGLESADSAQAGRPCHAKT